MSVSNICFSIIASKILNPRINSFSHVIYKLIIKFRVSAVIPGKSSIFNRGLITISVLFVNGFML